MPLVGLRIICVLLRRWVVGLFNIDLDNVNSVLLYLRVLLVNVRTIDLLGYFCQNVNAFGLEYLL